MPRNIRILVSSAQHCENDHRRELMIWAALQWHYRILQALALDEDVPESPEDKTTPKYRQMDKVRYSTSTKKLIVY